ncbi:SRPBCC domain-containing protein [Arthrobacter koreensis]|uniref:SRPBCC family protein n=1 Tax=Arthrobacter koreensis TaxID=199136 RepID=UPI003634C14D
MSVKSIDKDYDTLTITALAEFEAAPERVWELWADPRKLEGWWGPPTYPATVREHSLAPGGKVTYFMTGPDGQTYHGWWAVQQVDAPRQLSFRDGFADQDGTRRDDMPVTQVTVTLTARDGGTAAEIVTSFADRTQMDELISMGAVEGAAEAMSQMDAILASA